MKSPVFIVSLLILLGVTPSSHAQLAGHPMHQTIKGQIIDSTRLLPLANAHLYNESLRFGAITNDQGYFTIKAYMGDTLVVSALGYMSRVIILDEPAISRELTVKLDQRLYEIEAVSINAFSDYTDFQHKFMALELPKTQTEILKENIDRVALVAIDQAIYDKKTKETLKRNNEGDILYHSTPIKHKIDLQRENYARVLDLEKKQRVIDKKYNRGIIAKITQLSEDEITEFMGFCNFSMEYLYRASEYEILVRIEEKFKEYLYYKSRGELYREQIFDWFCYT